MVTNLTAAGFMANQTWPYFAAVAGVSAHLLWQVGTHYAQVDCNQAEKQ